MTPDLAGLAYVAAQQVVSAKRRADTLIVLVRAMATLGDYDKCRQYVRDAGAAYQDRALVEAVHAAAERDLTAALTLAGGICELRTRGRALVAAARRQRDPAVVRTLVGAAMRYGSWSEVLSESGDLPADVVTAVADGVSAALCRPVAARRDS
jgi:hypothetical protein